MRETARNLLLTLILTACAMPASAASVIGVKLDLYTNAWTGTGITSVLTGTGWFQFDVDPNNLPLGQWLDLSAQPNVSGWLSYQHLSTGGTESGAITEISALWLKLENTRDGYSVEFEGRRRLPEPWAEMGGHLRAEMDEPLYGLESNLVVWKETGTPNYRGWEYVCPGAKYFEQAYNTGTWEATVVYPANPVPIPAAVWLFGSAMAGFGFIAKKRKGVEPT